ncbi:hypothetical protein [Bacillus sp. H1m]|uniref:hypothetical protein n=1 Tax=Bacillus sp. H1m TaxID=1397277 RepID=UPI000468176D|nr:hypothetical protein [Bacillus sp. H1m]
MRRKVNLRTSSEMDSVTDVWIQHLIQRLIVEQLDVPYRLKAQLLHQTLKQKQNEEDSIEK